MNYKLRRSIQQLMVVGITATFATGAFAALGQQNPPPGPNQVPDYFGIVPNFANSPEPVLAAVSSVTGAGTGAAVTTYDYNNWATTPRITDVQGGTGYANGDVLSIVGGAANTSCSVTVNNVSGTGAITPNVDANGTVTGPGITLATAASAAATVDTTTGSITGIAVTYAGTGYTSAPKVTISAPTLGGVSNVTATATAAVDKASGGISITLVDAGSGYDSLNPPTITIDAPANLSCTGFTTPIAGTGIRKFLDALPGIPGVSSYLTGAGYDTNGANLLGQSLPVAVADTTTFPGSDYYEIEETEYTKQLHSDLPATHLRGYRQLNNGTDASGANTVVPPTGNQYLGPIIVAKKGRAVRIKLVNHLSKGAAGKLPLPVDTTYMGADTALATDNRTALHLHGGNTPWISDGTPRQTVKPKNEGTSAQNKGESARDVPDMWFDATSGNLISSCAGQLTCTTANATNNPGDGSLTYYFTNQQSARLMFYHDHAEGITRLNVYAGMAAGYIIQDPTEQAMVKGGTAYAAAQQMGYKGTELAKYDSTSSAPIYPAVLPDLPDTIPLVIQEKTFVPNNTKPVMNFYAAFASQLQSQDPTWRWGTTGFDANGNVVSTGPNGNGDLWVPHVFMPNQNPGDISGGNAMGRWDYGPWFWPPFTAISNGPINNPYYDPLCNTTASYCEPTQIPGVPNGSTAGVKNAMNGGAVTTSPSGTPEAFNDTPLVNGTAYPYINLDPKQYRLRLLSVGNDRMLNLSLVIAASKNSKTTADDNAGSTGQAKLCDGTDKTINPADCTEVKMVPFTSTQNSATPFPSHWYTQQKGGVTFDGRPSGVFDPKTRGPAMVQIGTEGGFLSSPVVIKNQPVNYEYNPKNILIGNIKEHALLLGPAERADVLVDFSKYAGATLIMYNDAPAPMPAWDLRLDYYTGNYDNTDTGGAFSTIPGYGPNTHTVMQIRISSDTSKGGTVAASADTSRDSTGSIKLPELTTAVQTAFRTSQEPIIVPQAAYNPVYGTSVPDSLGTDLSRIADYQLTFKPLIKDATTGNFSILSSDPTVTLDMAPKTIIEDWTMNWGRMNALLGTEVPRTTSTIQTSIPQAYIDPPTELVKITPNTNATPISGTLADGTSLWKITHNGVDSHSIHFHLFHVQIVNRVGWDGAIYPPEANELGWKDAVLMHPLSDVIVALRPMTMELPFKVANSHRKIDPSSNASGTDFFNLNPMTGNAANVTGNNLDMDYGWEYVWHCHILGHEENDMMRAIAVAQPPEAPTVLAATTVANGVKLDWKDNSMTANWVEITRSLDGVMKADKSGFQTVNATFNMPVASLIDPATGKAFAKKECDLQAGCLLSYTDKTAAATTSYYYRVVANNTVGGGAGRADKPLVAVASGGWDYKENLPAAVNSLVPNLTDAVTGVNGYSGYANVTASSDAATASLIFAPIANVSPGSITFPTTNFGSTAGGQSITIKNTGTGVLNIAGISLTGPFTRGTSTSANNVLYAGNCLTTTALTNLAPNASCTYNVTFSPTIAGCTGTATGSTVGCNGILTVTDNSNNQANSKQAVNLTGIGQYVVPSAPAVPSTANVTQTGLTLNWAANASAQSYTVQRATNVGFTTGLVTTPNVATNSLAVTGLTANTRYYFRVAAVNPAGTSAYSGSTNTTTFVNPVAVADTFTTANNTATTNTGTQTINNVINVRNNDTPNNAGTVTVVSGTSVGTGGATGVLTCNAATGACSLAMTPPASATTTTARQLAKRGTYTFTYTLTYGSLTTAATSVTITVR